MWINGRACAKRNFGVNKHRPYLLSGWGCHQQNEIQPVAEKAKKAKKAKKAAMAVGHGALLLRRSQKHPASLDPQQIQENKKEHSARVRRGKVEAELRKLFYGNNIPTALLNSRDGRFVNIGSSRWLANEFTVDFSSGEASWTDLEEGKRVAYRGLVLIDRRDFDSFVRNTQQSTMSAVTKCTEWARELPDKPVMRKSDFVAEAMKLFEGLLQTQARKVWNAEVPDNWKRAGRKS